MDKRKTDKLKDYCLIPREAYHKLFLYAGYWWTYRQFRLHQEYWESNYKYVKEILPVAEIYVYVIEKTIIGFIGLNKNYIEGIFIDTNNQGNGIGTLLLNKVKERQNTLTLNVYKKNTHAIHFYKKNGFIITNENIDENTGELEYTMVWNK